MTHHTTKFVKISAAHATDVCADFKLNREARTFLREDMSPEEFLEALVENKMYCEAIDFIAHALPAREAIWWGCLCMQHVLGDDLLELDREAAAAAVRWVMQPGEEHRTGAKAPAEVAGSSSLAGTLAKAVFLSDGDITLPNIPKPLVRLPAAKAVARAIKLACFKSDPTKTAKIQKSYIDLAIDVAEGHLI
jgi:hypothetical protein